MQTLFTAEEVFKQFGVPVTIEDNRRITFLVKPNCFDFYKVDWTIMKQRFKEFVNKFPVRFYQERENGCYVQFHTHPADFIDLMVCKDGSIFFYSYIRD